MPKLITFGSSILNEACIASITIQTEAGDGYPVGTVSIEMVSGRTTHIHPSDPLHYYASLMWDDWDAKASQETHWRVHPERLLALAIRYESSLAGRFASPGRWIGDDRYPKRPNSVKGPAEFDRDECVQDEFIDSIAALENKFFVANGFAYTVDNAEAPRREWVLRRERSFWDKPIGGAQ